jgi:ribosomal-protein-alanine N-acetyltransferase
VSATVPGWPVVLRLGEVTVRPLQLRDAPAWMEARKRNIDWLAPWEASRPDAAPAVPTALTTFVTMTRALRREASRGRGMPFAIDYAGEFVGQLNVSSIIRGSLQSASLGYWVDSKLAGQGVMPTAVALVTDHCFEQVGLHRIEVNIRPENLPSRRVVEKLGFREEGVRRAFLHIAGDWRDHVSYALTKEEVPGGLVMRLQRQR